MFDAMTEAFRRRFLSECTAAVAATVAGCSSGPSTSTTATTDTTAATTTSTATTDPTTSEPTTTETQVLDDGPFAVRNVQFSAARPTEYRDVEAVPDAEFAAGAAMYVYTEPENVARRTIGDGEVEYSVTLTSTVSKPGGEALGTAENVVDGTVERGADFSTFYVWQRIELPSDAERTDYDLEVVVTDDVADETATTTLDFAIVDQASSADYLAAFESAMTDGGLNGEFVDAAVDDGVVSVELDSGASARSDDWNYDVGYTAGAYAAIINQGWSSTRLDGRIHDVDDATHRFTVDRETCVAWNEGRLSDDEFVSRVMDSIEEV